MEEWLKGIGKSIYGLFLPEYEGTFKEAYRNARINGNDKFIWNGNHYNTELSVHPLIEALKQWDTKGDLGKEEFKNQALRNQSAFIDFYSKSFPTHFKNNNFDILYGNALNYERNTVPNTNNKLGRIVYNNLTDGWTDNLIAAAMGNSYVETGGWKLLAQIGGPARGLFMLEEPEQKAYRKWLKNNALKDTHDNQVNYVQHLFDTKSESLQTPWSRLHLALPTVNEARKKAKQSEIKTIEELLNFVKSLKSAKEANKYGVRSAWQHQDYTTEQAWKDWNGDNLDNNTKAFEALFERAGIPNMERRYYLSHLINKNQNIYRK